MSNESYNETRDMSGRAITETYKGILRVSNNKNLISGVDDVFLSKNYYFSTSENETKTFEGNGIQTTIPFLDSAMDYKRFQSDDLYKNFKLPVTDSMGNFLNFALGCDGSLIGTEPDVGKIINGENFDSSSSISVLTSENPAYIGLSKKDLKPLKKIEGGSLYIDNSDTPATLTIVNRYLHNSNDGTEDSVISSGNTGINEVRTIFSSSDNVQKNDVFYFDQENTSGDSKTTLDCHVELKNLETLVQERISNFINNNSTPVPTGTIISQFCSLDKWFCYDEASSGFDDFSNWQGFRPSMSSAGSVYSIWNKTSGNALYTSDYLYKNGITNSDKTNELAPDFKRGYLLCDGRAVDIYLTPSFITGKEMQQKSFDLFFDLFYVLGYYYKNSSHSMPKIFDIKEREEKTGFYKFKNDNPVRRVVANADLDVLYGMTMATCLVFKWLEAKSKAGFVFSSVDDVLEILKNEYIEDDYIFNVIDPRPDNNNEFFLYNNSSLDTKNVEINIGKEINSFSDPIPYYFYNAGTQELEIIDCPIYQMAETYHLVDMYVNRKNINNAERSNSPRYIPLLFLSSQDLYKR